MTTTPAQRCKRCAEKAGLSILLVRPTAIAIAIAIDPDFAPANAADLKTHEPSAAAFKFGPMKKSRFALRMLRQRGFVYAYDTNPPSNAHSWKAYRVHASGVLIEVDLSAPMDEEVRFSCNLQPTHPHDLRTLRVQLPQIHPEKAAPVWIGFSMNWWDDNMRARVLRDPSAAGVRPQRSREPESRVLLRANLRRRGQRGPVPAAHAPGSHREVAASDGGRRPAR